MLLKSKLIITISLLGVLFTGIFYTPAISGTFGQPITQILTDSGYVYPDKNGTIDLRTSSKISSISSVTIPSYNQMDFAKIDSTVNYIDLHFTIGVSDLSNLKDSEPLDGVVASVIITPKTNEMKTPLKIELLINGEDTNQIITIPALSLSPISVKINQPFHQNDSLVWHTLDTVPNTLKIDAYTVVIYNDISQVATTSSTTP